MILLDTHVWVWWVQGDTRLAARAIEALDRQGEGEIGVHVISCWEIAMLHARNRLMLPESLEEWLAHALGYPGVREVSLTAKSAVASCCLPGNFHKDPADRMLVAAAMELGVTLVTADRKILDYQQVESLHPDALV